jgi:hypothetical protein
VQADNVPEFLAASELEVDMRYDLLAGNTNNINIVPYSLSATSPRVASDLAGELDAQVPQTRDD